MPSEAMLAAPQRAPVAEPGCRRGRAWLVIGERQDARSIAEAMRSEGWQLAAILHDMTGVQRLLAQRAELPDIVVTGLRFDDGDGFQLMRALSRCSRPPAVFIVSRQQRAVIRAAVALAAACGLPMAGFAEQPVDAASIARSVCSYTRPAPARIARPAAPELGRGELLELFDRGALFPWMQPKLRIGTQEVVGFEALMRAHDTSGALVMPDRLVAALARHNLLDQATLRMAKQTVDFVAACLGEGLAISASINVSMQSLSNLAFCQELAAAVEHVQLDPSWITIEITETDAMADLASVIENTGRIRMLGFNLAIDDFGTAYSSLFQLSRIPFSELKIERAFVTGIEHDSGKQAIMKACAQLGASLGLHVVAEGVETARELECVRRAGCTLIQGYLVSRPMPADRAFEWLRGLDELRFELPAETL